MELSAALGPSHGDRRPWVVARLLAVDTVANRAQVTIDGSPPVSLPLIPGMYDGITTVFVLMDPERAGSGQLVLGPCYQEAPAEIPAEVIEPEPAPAAPTTVTATALIRPLGSSTWRHIRSDWDRWNVSMYGGRTDLYQGNAYGSGQLTGLAWYGNQIVDLNATEILSVKVATPPAYGSGTITLQGAPHSSRPSGGPAPSGATASGTTSVTLSSAMREALRTGAAKSLATVGGNYRSSYGSAHPSGMSLSIEYRKPA